MKIWQLLVAVALCSVAFAAFRAENAFWTGMVRFESWTIVLAAILLIIHRRGVRCAFAIGFALFALPYLALAYLPVVQAAHPARALLEDVWGPRIVTKLSASNPNFMRRAQALTPNGNWSIETLEDNRRYYVLRAAPRHEWLAIGIDLGALAFGALGGALSVLIERQECRARTQSTREAEEQT